MTLSFIRSFFIIICCIVGYYIGLLVQTSSMGVERALFYFTPFESALIGCLCALVLILIERGLSNVSVTGLSSVVFGLILGVFMAKLIANVLSLLPLGDFILSISEIILTIVFSYFGAVMAIKGKDEFNIIVPYLRFKRQDAKEEAALLDTSAIIDGRIADIYRVNFLSHRLVVPKFVLKELQALADSQDEFKRQRGKRGLDLLKDLQDDKSVEIHIHESQLEDEEVDAKLINLAKLMDAKLCTTDFNLTRIASFQGVTVLNINELADAVRSVVFAQDKLKVKLVKEGKEADQALAYMPDGTMIVVSDAKGFIGKEKEIIVTSVLQTQSGKMIFAKLLK